MGKNKSQSFDISKVMKPINPTPIIMAIILGLGSTLGAGVLGTSESNIKCDEVISRAIAEQKADPNVDVHYSGPADEKCGVNNIIDEWP